MANGISWMTDPEFEDHQIEDVEPYDGGWSVSFGASLWVPSERCSESPRVGETIRLFGRGFGYPVRGIVIDGRVYRYETPGEHKASHAAMCERMERERAERDRVFRESQKPELPTFQTNDPSRWQACVELNSADPYNFECMRFAATWASLMDHRGPDTALADIARECSREADTEGITGFMYGAAVSMLSEFWVRGEELRHWHNMDTQIGDEGDRANEKGGVLNPALLSIGVRE